VKARAVFAGKGAESQSIYSVRVDKSEEGYFSKEEAEALAKQVEALPKLVKALERISEGMKEGSMNASAVLAACRGALKLAGKP
jgi:hypothetical protein